MVYYKPQRHPTKGHPIIPIRISKMPIEDHHMPQETHEQLLKQGGNTHMPIQAYEVAWDGKDSMGVTIVRYLAFLLVFVITIVVASK
jgi:hypothetical protein